MEWWLAYLVLGLFVGFFAGLFGIGGGLVLVPVLTFWFEQQHLLPDGSLHLALGTSMAAIVFSACWSSYTHYRFDAVDTVLWRKMAGSLLAGTLLGAWLASSISVLWLSGFFTLFVLFAALQMLLNIRPKASRCLPNTLGLSCAGGLIGLICSLVSIGGGVLSVPFLLYHNVPIRRAIGTSAALGIPIAIGGSAGYLSSGFLVDTPEYSVGYIYLPALLFLALGSALTTPLGAQATHRLPTKILRPAFAVLLIGLAVKLFLLHR